MTGSSVEKSFLQYEINGNRQFPRITFYIDVSRKTTYYVINYIVPTILMVKRNLINLCFELKELVIIENMYNTLICHYFF